MRSFDFWRVDVFADRPLEGNPLAVFPRALGLSDAEMLAITREMNISETTFVLPPSKAGANYRNRIFTPGGELPFAGHPSLGTAYVAAMEGIVPLGEGTVTVHQEVKIGVLPLELHSRGGVVDRVVMTQGKPVMGKRITATAAVAKALGIRVDAITATGLLPQVASTGAPSLQVPIRSMKTAREMEPDMPALATVLRRVDPDAGAYVFAFEAEGNADLHARGFFPQAGIPEDPATGSAAGACGAYLAANGRLPTKEWFVIEQGIEVHHPSRIEVAVEMKGSRPKTVRVAGNVVPVMRGTLTLP
ncbi:MAG: PhzF family phenazine biosynthesis protein [Methanobacteriota archaeon]|nr:MAG: PhzF family phenazine biosynthesis protein [Euryarchaeota archaeon]